VSLTVESILNADPLPPYFNVDLPRQRNFSAGSTANLSCHASGIPRPVITWFKDGHRVPSFSVKEFKGHSILAFDSIRLNDQGKYWCEANSTEGWNRSSSVSLTGTCAYKVQGCYYQYNLMKKTPRRKPHPKSRTALA